MRLSTTTLFVSTLFLVSALFSPALATSFGIYHLSARQAAANCTVPRIPWNLCAACKLKPFNGTGPNLKFGGINRFDIYDLSTPQCKRMMQRYVDSNPCDTLRKNALANIDKPYGYKTMIYFMYSVCEFCCDCVPIGARVEQFAERRRTKTLINIARGNCAAHFFYDTCKIWPNAKQITGIKGRSFNFPDSAKWCPDFRTWQFSPNAKSWLKNPNVKGLTWKMRRAMNMLASKARCSEETQWKNCVNMELAQGRV